MGTATAAEVGSTTGSLIENNTVVELASSANPIRGFHLRGVDAVAINNIVVVHESCITADDTPISISNNDLFGCALLYTQSTISVGAVSDLNNLTHATGNLSRNPLLDATADYRLTASSPIAITEGGLDRSTTFNDDADGTSRTVPWSLGAFELDI